MNVCADCVAGDAKGSMWEYDCVAGDAKGSMWEYAERKTLGVVDGEWDEIRNFTVCFLDALKRPNRVGY